jgi:hypothetical protein
MTDSDRIVTTNVATVDMMLVGYAHSLGRLQDALKQRDATGGFRAAFEALNWAVAIDERIAKTWAPRGKPLRWRWRGEVQAAEVMAGVRFVRNRVHHDWADAFWFNEEGGLTFPMTFPVTFSTWRWRALSELPIGKKDDHGQDVYEQHLARQPVERTLFQIGVAFEQVGRLLEPPRATPLA